MHIYIHHHSELLKTQNLQRLRWFYCWESESYIFRVLKYPINLCKSSIPISFGSSSHGFSFFKCIWKNQNGREAFCWKYWHPFWACMSGHCEKLCFLFLMEKMWRWCTVFTKFAASSRLWQVKAGYNIMFLFWVGQLRKDINLEWVGGANWWEPSPWQQIFNQNLTKIAYLW